MFKNFCIALLVMMPVQAHDFWLETTQTEQGRVAVHGYIGSDFSGESQMRFDEWFSRFDVLTPTGTRAITGEMADEPMGHFVATTPGTYMGLYQSVPEFVKIDAKTFSTYLQEEGLHHALAYRRQHGLSETEGLERYTRYAKTLVQIGDVPLHKAATTPVGLSFEIVPEQHPLALQPASQLTVKVLHHGLGAADILLMALPKTMPTKIQRVRTDAKGRASIQLNQAGWWLLKAVRIERRMADTQDPANWHSDWASLTFRLPE